MAADRCKSVMTTALFAGTVFKGAGTHSAASVLGRRAVKIQHFAQSAGNFSTLTGTADSSETTRVDPTYFNA